MPTTTSWSLLGLTAGRVLQKLKDAGSGDTHRVSGTSPERATGNQRVGDALPVTSPSTSTEVAEGPQEKAQAGEGADGSRRGPPAWELPCRREGGTGEELAAPNGREGDQRPTAGSVMPCALTVTWNGRPGVIQSYRGS